MKALGPAIIVPAGAPSPFDKQAYNESTHIKSKFFYKILRIILKGDARIILNLQLQYQQPEQAYAQVLQEPVKQDVSDY